MNTQNIQNALIPSKAEITESKWFCIPCERYFDDFWSRATHRRTDFHFRNTSQWNHCCLICHPGTWFYNREAWTAHRRIVHDIVSDDQGPGSLLEQDDLRATHEKFRCLCCPALSRRYLCKQLVARHMITRYSFRWARANKDLCCTICKITPQMPLEEAPKHYLQHHTSDGRRTRVQSPLQSLDNSHVVGRSNEIEHCDNSPAAKLAPQIADNIYTSSGLQPATDDMPTDATPPSQSFGELDGGQGLMIDPPMLSEEEMEAESARILRIFEDMDRMDRIEEMMGGATPDISKIMQIINESFSLP